jgi:hypothetical protein
VLSDFSFACFDFCSLVLALAQFNSLANTVQTNFVQSAHSMSMLPSDMATGLTYGIFPKSSSEIYTRYIGLTPLFLALFFPFFKTYTFKRQEKIVLTFCLVVTFIMYLITLGAHSGAPDIFYNVFRVFGEMHIYGRYSELAHIFTILALVLLISKININKSQLVFKIVFVVALALLAVLLRFEYNTTITFEQGYVQYIIMEVFSFILILWLGLSLGKRWLVISMAAVMFLSNTNLFLQSYRGNNQATVDKHVSLDTWKIIGSRNIFQYPFSE